MIKINYNYIFNNFIIEKTKIEMKLKYKKIILFLY